MRYAPRTKVKQDNQRGAEVMSYLYDEYAADHPDKSSTTNVERGEDSARTTDTVEFVPMEAHSDDNENGHKLRLLNKFSSESGEARKRSFMHTPISEHVKNYRNFMGSPLVDSAITGLGIAGATYALGKYFNPIEQSDVLKDAVAILKAKGGPITQGDLDAAKQEALKRAKRSKLLFAGALGLGGAFLNSMYHYVPGDPSSIYKYACSGIDKKAGMLDPGSFMDINEVKAAVIDSPMTDGNKFLAMNMLDTINKPAVSSADIMNAAVATGASALGSPIGRYTVAAATNAALGYGAGKLLGIGRPDRLAATIGIGSFLMDSLQPTYTAY